MTVYATANSIGLPPVSVQNLETVITELQT
jgi:hypothetical protein